MTKLINGWYQDANGNKWDAEIYTKKQADRNSETLTNCFNCINCIHCSLCSRCTCCSDCSYCSNCSRCSDCSNCSSCSDCSLCSRCSDCSGCSYCSDFKDNPQRITSPNIGSRNSQTTIYWTDEHEQVVCGCFIGTLSEFETKVIDTHGDNQYEKEYFSWIEKVKKYRA